MTEPARKIRKSAVKNVVRFPPVKANNGNTILLESIQESKYCLHLEFSPDVITYFPQPKTFNIRDGSGNFAYTPDFLVLYADDTERYAEVKRKASANSPSNLERFSIFESRYLKQGESLLVVTEEEIYCRPKLSNYEKLYRYRQTPTLDKKNLYRCASSLPARITFGHLIKKLEHKASLKEIYTWIAFGYLYFDMTASVLSVDTELKFNVA